VAGTVIVVCHAPEADPFEIRPGVIDARAGAYSFASFAEGVRLCTQKRADALCTLPIHKKAWELAGIPHKGHTDALRHFFGCDAIMMLGCPELFVALYTEHIPLRSVADTLDETTLSRFLCDFHAAVEPPEVAVLGLNPHAGDGGVLGDEERIVEAAIRRANAELGGDRPVFVGPIVPDIAFTPAMRKRFRYYVALYHDQGLAPLKALHFDESINVSLGLPIVRTSVDHGTAFDIAYRKDRILQTTSYRNAVRYAAKMKPH